MAGERKISVELSIKQLLTLREALAQYVDRQDREAYAGSWSKWIKYLDELETILETAEGERI